jgi:hypothetical protein
MPAHSRDFSKSNVSMAASKSFLSCIPIIVKIVVAPRWINAAKQCFSKAARSVGEKALVSRHGVNSS